MTRPTRTRLTLVAVLGIVAASLLVTPGPVDAAVKPAAIRQLVSAATAQPTPSAGRAAAVRALAGLTGAARRNAAVSQVRHQAVGLKIGRAQRCVTWYGATHTVVKTSCVKTWAGFARAVTKAKRKHTARAGRAAAVRAVHRLPKPLRSHSRVSPVRAHHVTVSVGGHHRCLTWAGAHAMATAGFCASSGRTPLVGVYAGGPGGDNSARKLFGSYAQISSSYYQPDQAGLSISAEEARMRKGIAPLITITTKGTTYLSDIADKSGPGWTWVHTYVDALATLGAYAQKRNLPIYAAVDHEWEVKVNQGTFTGDEASTAVYAKALSNFFALCNAEAPHVTTLYWFGGADRSAIGAVGSKLTTAPRMLSFDPYSSSSHSASESLHSLVSPTLTWLRSRPWYRGQRIGLSEFGAYHADASMAKFYAHLRPHLRAAGLAFGVFFNRTDTPYVVTLTDARYPRSVAAVAASLPAG